VIYRIVQGLAGAERRQARRRFPAAV